MLVVVFNAIQSSIQSSFSMVMCRSHMRHNLLLDPKLGLLRSFKVVFKVDLPSQIWVFKVVFKVDLPSQIWVFKVVFKVDLPSQIWVFKE